MSNIDPTQKTGVNLGAREGKAVPASYKTLAVLHIYTQVRQKSW
jgi:hypothetical protein